MAEGGEDQLVGGRWVISEWRRASRVASARFTRRLKAVSVGSLKVSVGSFPTAARNARPRT